MYIQEHMFKNILKTLNKKIKNEGTGNRIRGKFLFSRPRVRGSKSAEIDE
jgi:hypothetical protein